MKNKFTKKHILTLALCFLLLCSYISVGFETSAVSIENDDILRYVVYDNYVSVLSVINKNVKEIIIPESFNEKPVTVLGQELFYKSEISNIILPDTIKIIERSAFSSCKNLESIEIPEGVTGIGVGAFSGCTGLTSITIPDSVKSIGSSAFKGCTNLKSITIPEGVTSIGGYAFSGCSKLISVELPNNSNYKIIESCMFEDCVSLLEIVIPESVTSIKAGAFTGCASLINLSIPNNVDTIGENAFKNVPNITFDKNNMLATGSPWRAKTCNGYVDGYLVYNNESKEIISACSASAEGFIEIPNSVTTINWHSFTNCIFIKDLFVPSSVTTIYGDPFFGVQNIRYENGSTDNKGARYVNKYVEENFVYEDETKETLLVCYRGLEGSVIVPQTVKEIKKSAFSGCDYLIGVTIPNTVQIIDTEAMFSGCDSLKYANINCPINTIGTRCFYNCYSIESYSIPDGVKKIGESAFSGCKSLKYVYIPDSIKHIENYAFFGCISIQSIKIPNNVETIAMHAFYLVNLIEYDEFKLKATGSPWDAKFVNAYIEDNLAYYDSNKTILLGCLSSAEGNVTVPDTVEYVGDNAFAGCENVTDITFKGDDIVFSQDMLTDIGENSKLVKIDSPNTTSDGITYTYNPNPTTVPQQKQAESSNLPILTKVANFLKASSDVDYTNYRDGNAVLFCNRDRTAPYTVPSGIIAICDNAFANCNIAVTIPDSLSIERIGKNAFLNSKQYNSWNKSGVFTIGNYVICAATSLNTYSLPTNILCIADSAFENCSSLSSFKSSGSLKHIGKGSFKGCSALSTVTLPSAVETIGEGAFEDTRYYTSNSASGAVYIGNCLIGVPEDAETVVINPNTTCIASGAFKYCGKLKSVTIPDSVKKIGNNTFEWCLNLEEVDLGNISSLGSYAFKDCRSLRSVTIPASLNRIDSFAFYRCDEMESFDVAEDNPNYTAENGVLYNKDKTTLIQYPAGKTESDSSFIIPESVTYLEGRSFAHCINLAEITIPEGVKLANYNPFEFCTARVNNSDYTIQSDTLVYVSNVIKGEFIVPAGVTKIGDGAFTGCNGITAIVFNGKETVIGENAFKECTGLTEVTFPKTIRSIEKSAFENCSNLEEVSFTPDDNNSTLESIGDKAFYGTALTITDEELAAKFNKTVIADGAKVICNHDYEEVSCLAPTCTNKGYKDQKCKYCGTIIRLAIPETGHKVSDLIIENETFSSCNEAGTYDEVYRCEVCEIELSRETKTKELGEHITDVKEENIIEATCTAAGTYDEVTYCASCNEEFDRIQKTVSAEGHKPGKTKKENEKTDLKKSIITWDAVTYCSVCGEKYKTEKKQDSIKVTVDILNMSKYNRQTLPYKSTVTFHADVENTLPENIHWYVNEKEVDTGESYTVTKATASYTIKAKVIVNGIQLAKSETETIKINTSFFAKIKTFFQSLFGKLPVYDQK